MRNGTKLHCARVWIKYSSNLSVGHSWRRSDAPETGGGEPFGTDRKPVSRWGPGDIWS